MKRLVPGLVLALSLPASVLAQKSDGSVHAEFYAFTAPVVSNTQYYFNPNASRAACLGPFQQGQQPPPEATVYTSVSARRSGVDKILRLARTSGC